MSVTFRTNMSAWESLAKVFRRLDNEKLEVGIFDGEVALIGAVHEFGSPSKGIPERSYIRSTIRDREKNIEAFIGRVLQRVLEDRLSSQTAMEFIGQFLVNAIKFQITNTTIPPPLAVATIKRKGSSRPLVDTGRMLNSINWRIVP